ncbi:MAG TPA: hypothetical protein VNO86_02210 [Candidatus Binatia bacterium]|nr:hypothetical protein [Candidatus Binatia bacterium]
MVEMRPVPSSRHPSVPDRVAGLFVRAAVGAMIAAFSLSGIVGAISDIRNEMTITPRLSLGCYAYADLHTHTSFGWFPPPNPYPSDYAVAIDATHFYLPEIYYRVGESGSFVYKRSEGSLGGRPAYWYASGLQWFSGFVQYDHYLYADLRTTRRNNQPGYVKNWHGQADIFSSYGDPAVVYTQHLSC